MLDKFRSLFSIPPEGYEICERCGATTPKFTTSNDDEVWAAHHDNCYLKITARRVRNLDFEYGLRDEPPEW